MIKQKSSKVKQAILPFILETAQEIITPRAGLVLFGEFVYGLRLNQRADKYLPLPKSGRGYKPLHTNNFEMHPFTQAVLVVLPSIQP